MKHHPRDPWERQPGEAVKAFRAFVAYRDDDDRSLVKVGRELGRSPQLIERWSKRWRWVERVASWADHLDAEKRRARVRAIEELEERHAQLAKSTLNLVVKELIRRQSQPLERMSVTEMARLFEVSVKVERLALGADTERVAVEHSGEVETRAKIDLSKLSNETLDRLIAELGA
jgi:hypothetical protein